MRRATWGFPIGLLILKLAALWLESCSSKYVEDDSARSSLSIPQPRLTFFRTNIAPFGSEVLERQGLLTSASKMNQTAFATPATLSTSVFAPKTAICGRNDDLQTARPRPANVTMVSQTNIAKKQVRVQAAKDKLSPCQMIFAASLEGLTVANVMDLKTKLPAGSKAAVVKNTLMRRAIEDSEWEVAGDLVKQSSLWFFVEEDMKGTMKVYDEFANETKRDAIKGGVFEGMHQDTKGIEAIAALPSKKELLTKIAVSVKMVPTKLARSVNAVPTKLARAIKLAVADEEGDSSE